MRALRLASAAYLKAAEHCATIDTKVLLPGGWRQQTAVVTAVPDESWHSPTCWEALKRATIAWVDDLRALGIRYLPGMRR